MVNEKELKVIEEISREAQITQREISRRTKLSLGAVNVIIKRLMKRGMVKTRNLNPRKIEYIITPTGFTEKTQKTYNYVLKTVNLVKLVREEIAKIVLEEYNRGQKKFIVLGSDDLADIIELALKGFDYERVQSIAEVKNKNAVVLKGKNPLRANGFRVIDVAARLGESYWGVEL